ncbi:Tectonic-2 Precursor [Takifugu flavidus]|uniref:Tectonic-2 n=1 Tax=Takifugu flavidus TaxID=433684 RepID=A0A5C6N126_9TELE|nr:Tectonic-2 Precursor [Takifugu flavidus]
MPPLSLLMRLINVNQMANAFDVSLASIFHHFTSIFIFVSLAHGIGSVDYPSCAPEKTQWVLTKVPVGKTATSVHLRLNRSLRLCSENETDTDCCPKPLCVLETLQLSACMGDAPTTSALIQAKIYTQLLPVNDGSDNKTTIPNLYETFGSCPCDLTFQACDVRCCCDKIVLGKCVNGDVMVDVIDEVAPDLSEFISSKTSNAVQIDGDRLLVLTTRYSAAFLNGQVTSEPNSGNPGYQVGRPVIAGNENNDTANTTIIQRNSINLWKPVSDGMCSSADKDPVLFGFNKTSGCLLPVSLQNLTQCNLLRESVRSMQEALLDATLVAKNGRPDAQSMTDWADISFMASNSSTDAEDTAGSCNGIPSHQHIQIWSRITGFVNAVPQRDIIALHISYSPSAWTLDCRGSDIAPCEYPLKTHLFPVTSSVTFMDVPVDTGPPKTRFQITFTEYDCDRNDVCWPELGFPLTRYYTGEPFSQSLAKGLILVFLFIIASVLGTPWRQIRQAWNSF